MAPENRPSERRLHDYLDEPVAMRAASTAIEDPAAGRSIRYGELDRLSDRLRDRLHARGVRPGDRVGIYLGKSIDSLAAIFGTLKCGAAYVPVDPVSPPPRNAYILGHCEVAAVVIDRARLEPLRADPGFTTPRAGFIVLDVEPGEELPLARALRALDTESPAEPRATVKPPADTLAYILYTTGSTGRPKGVMITHRNAVSFVDWCSDTFRPVPDDRFSSHASFHFDLSVLDIYLPLKHGATLVLFDERTGRDPVTLAAEISARRITSWYSTPSILSLLVQFGHLERFDYGALRIVHFAGEVFPVKYLRALKAAWPAPRYFNLYGPTETNVCTWYEIPAVVPPGRTEPFPIGKACAHYTPRIAGPDGTEVARGEEGELWISGPGVMRGYWNAPELDRGVFVTDPDGTRWYRTGDIVREDAAGDLVFVGRRDRMVKKRGYRIELGEIEAALYTLPDVQEVAVITRADPDSGVRVRAFLSFRGPAPSIIQLKQSCAAVLLQQMIPDQFTILETLPKTSTGKTDYQALRGMP